MEFIDNYVEAKLNLLSAEKEFISELCKTLNLSESNIKSIRLENHSNNLMTTQMIRVELTGSNRFKSSDVAKINGLVIVTPNTLEIKIGEYNL